GPHAAAREGLGSPVCSDVLTLAGGGGRNVHRKRANETECTVSARRRAIALAPSHGRTLDSPPAAEQRTASLDFEVSLCTLAFTSQSSLPSRCRASCRR